MRIIANLKFILIVVGVLTLHLVLLINTQFTLWPEMVVYPYLMNKGFLLYKDIINPYPPGFNYFLSFFANLFGYDHSRYQLLTWLIILVIDLTIFFVSYSIFRKRLFALTASLFFVVFSIPFGVNGLWYDLAIIPLALFSAFFFNQFLKEKKQKFSKNLISCSLFLTAAFFIKQQSILIVIAYIAVYFSEHKKDALQEIFAQFKENYVSLLIPFLALAVFIFMFSQKNNLNDYLYYTLAFPLIASKFPGYVLLPNVKQLIFVLALLMFFLPFYRYERVKSLYFYVALLFIFFAYPRFDYFHLIPALAFLSIFVGKNLSYLKKSMVLAVISGACLVALLLFFQKHIMGKFQVEDRFFNRNIYYQAAVMDYIIDPSEKVYIQNAPDQIMVILQLEPIKPWAIQFPWYLEKGNLRARTISSLQSEKPKYIIYQPYSNGPNYDIGNYKPEQITSYIDQNYTEAFKVSENLVIKTLNHSD